MHDALLQGGPGLNFAVAVVEEGLDGRQRVRTVEKQGGNRLKSAIHDGIHEQRPGDAWVAVLLLDQRVDVLGLKALDLH